MSLEVEVKRTKMTRFLCQELLYDHVSETLDPRRQEDVREHLKDCKESQRELEKLKRGLAYVDKAERLEVSSRLHEALLNFEPHWQKVLREWTLWSSQRGWKMLPYIFVVLTVAVGLGVTKPWRHQESTEVTLAEQLQKEPDMVSQDEAKAQTLPAAPPVDTAKIPPVASAPNVESAVPAKPTAPINPPPDVTPTDVAAAASHVSINSTPPNVLPAPKPQPAAQVDSGLKPLKGFDVPKKGNQPTAEELSDKSTEAPISARGSISRGEIVVADFANSWPAIRDKIISLDGKVAGNVELGWLRRPDQSYFHFSLPESNYSELELFLGTFGPVRFVKERHPRVMPEGQIRIILTVKDAVTHESSGQTP